MTVTVTMSAPACVSSVYVQLSVARTSSSRRAPHCWHWLPYEHMNCRTPSVVTACEPSPPSEHCAV